MKPVYFEILDFESKMPEEYEFYDLGYVENLLETTKTLVSLLGHSSEEENLKKLGFKLEAEGTHLKTGIISNHAKISWIYYLKKENYSDDILIRAHEEAHAVWYLGVKEELKTKMGLSNSINLHEEDFCDQAGLYALRKRSLELNPKIIRLGKGNWEYVKFPKARP